MRERQREGERYSIRIRRKLLCCHQPFGGKHSELVCVAASGYNCLDVDIVRWTEEGEERERQRERGRESAGGGRRRGRGGGCGGGWAMGGCEVWIQEIGMAFTQCLGKSGSTARGENCL